MLGAWAGHVTATRDWTPRREGAAGPAPPADPRLAAGAAAHPRREIPLALVMVALTTLTLWSLGQAIVVEEDAAGSGRPVGRPADQAAPVPGTHSVIERTCEIPRPAPGRAPRRPRRPSRSRSGTGCPRRWRRGGSRPRRGPPRSRRRRVDDQPDLPPAISSRIAILVARPAASPSLATGSRVEPGGASSARGCPASRPGGSRRRRGRGPGPRQAPLSRSAMDSRARAPRRRPGRGGTSAAPEQRLGQRHARVRGGSR